MLKFLASLFIAAIAVVGVLDSPGGEKLLRNINTTAASQPTLGVPDVGSAYKTINSPTSSWLGQ